MFVITYIALKTHFIFHLTKYKMSQANAAARKRRAGGASIQDGVAPVQNSQSQPPKSGLTLPQVISLVDKRLITLETFMRESQNGASTSVSNASLSQSSNVSEDAVNQLADEFNSKFEMLAREMADLKDTILKLQTFTMDVNKTLFEERIQVLSDMGENKEGGIDFYISDNDEIIDEIIDDKK
jgi:hypothetical protein